jgi:hypothetical protein
MFLQEYWLEEIKKDINKKYKVANPVFTVGEQVCDYKDIRKWVFSTINPTFNWLHYKKISEDKFELSFFSPHAEDDICNSITKKFLDGLPEEAKLFTLSYTSTGLGDCSEESLSYTEIIVGESVYDLDEIQGELLYLVRNGKSKIDFFMDPTEQGGALVYNLYAYEETLPKMLKSGYLKLEYFD